MSFYVPNAGLRRKEAQTTKYEETKLLREQVETHASSLGVETMRWEKVDTDAWPKAVMSICKRITRYQNMAEQMGRRCEKSAQQGMEFNVKVSGHHEFQLFDAYK